MKLQLLLFLMELGCTADLDYHSTKSPHFHKNEEINNSVKEFREIVNESIKTIEEILVKNNQMAVPFTGKNIDRLKNLQEMYSDIYERSTIEPEKIEDSFFRYADFSNGVALLAQRYAKDRKISIHSYKKFELLSNRLIALYNRKNPDNTIEYEAQKANL